MKKKIFVFTLIFGYLNGSSAKEAGKNPTAYEIKKVSVDATLSDSEAVVVFTCYEYISYPMANRNIVYAHDSGANRDVKTSAEAIFRVTLKPGKHLFDIASFGREEISIPDLDLKSRTQTEVALYFREDDRMRPMKKPVIYFYPEYEMEVGVKLDVPGGLDFTYPPYGKGWGFGAMPNGDLYFGGKTYRYLFWEGNAKMDAADLNSKEGFVVSRDSLVDFFENKLGAMGLNACERTDFITYWAPLMIKNENCFIHFLFKEDLEKYASLSIEPSPDNLFRVFMLWRPVTDENESAKISTQKIPIVKRSGFTVIEWGGTEIVSPRP